MFKEEEMLLEFHARSDQTKSAARAAHSFNGKVQNLN